MKKKLFAIFGAFSLILSGCSIPDTFNSVLSMLGIKQQNDSNKKDDKTPHTHVDADHDGTCDDCHESGLTVTHVDEDHDDYCDVCHAFLGTEPCNHADTNHDGVCDLCGETGLTVNHVDANHDGVCDGCGASGLEVVHVDEDHDDYCDVCHAFLGAEPCVHEDSNHDGVCDLCGETGLVVNHVDANHDGICDDCGIEGLQVTHVDEDHDDYCDVCHEFLGENPQQITYSTNAYEHWYIDEHGVEHREEHHFHLESHLDETCTETSEDVYVCEICNYSKIEKGSTYAEHDYVSEVTLQPTCKEPGIVTFHCTNCEEGSYEVEIPINANAHEFEELSNLDGVKTLRCKHCELEKTVIDYSDRTSAPATKDALQEVGGEVQLQSASIAFDEQTLNNDIGSDVTIGAQTKPAETVVEELELDEEFEEKLQGKPIIDLSVVDNNTNEKISSFSGKVKVTIPYELQQGEDPNGIVIYYLSENEPVAIQADYANGNVTFETDHFSYYAVVHLKTEEVCKEFGHHIAQGKTFPSTCYAHGYKESVCVRCGHVNTEQIEQLADHNYVVEDSLAPTETKEGYIIKVCSVCHDVQKTILPKIIPSETPSGFYENLVKTLFTPEFKITMSVNVDGDDFSNVQYMGRDEEGLYFEYSPQYPESFVYQGIQYSSYETHGRVSDPFRYFDIVQIVLNYIPQIYKDKAEELMRWFVDKYFVKEEVDDGLENVFSLNTEALYRTYTDFRDNSIADAVKLTIGEEIYNKIFGFIEDNYEKPLSQVIDLLESKGFSLEALYNAVVQILATIMGEEFAQKMPPFDQLIPEQMKSMTIPQILNLIMYQMMSPAYEENFDGYDFDNNDESEISSQEAGLRLRNEEPQEGEEAPEIPQIVPETYDDLMGRIEPYMNLNLIDMILMFTGADPEHLDEARQYIVGMADGVADEIVENGSMSLRTTKEGGFISYDAELTELHNPTNNEEFIQNFHVNIVKSFDKDSILKILKEKAQKVEEIKEITSLSSSNYEWLAKPYEDYYSQTYEGIKFEWRMESFEDYRKAFLVSSQPYSINNGNDETYDAYIVLPLNYVEYYDEEDTGYKKFPGQVVINEKGYGTKLGKGETGFVTQAAELVSNAYLMPVSVENDYGYQDLNRLNFGILYNIDQHEFFYTCIGGSFNYLTYNSIVDVTQISAEQAAKYDYWFVRDEEGWEDKYYFFEVEYETGYKSLDYISKTDSWELSGYHPLASSIIKSESMNDEALENSGALEYAWEFVDGEVVKHIRVENSSLPFDVGEYRSHHDSYGFNIEQDFSKTFYNGNLRAFYDAKLIEGQPQCVRQVSWEVYVDNEVIYSDSYIAHFNDTRICTYHNESIGVENCKETVVQSYTCNYCEKVVHKQFYTYDHHNYGEMTNVPLSDTTLTHAGFGMYEQTCQDCGQTFRDYYYESPCDHKWMQYNEETGLWVCQNCGFEASNNETPIFVFEKLSEDEDTITFSFYTPQNSWEWEDEYFDYLSNYSFELCLSYVDEEGTIHALTNLDNPNVVYETKRVSIGDFFKLSGEYYGWWKTYTRTVTFDKKAFDTLLDQYGESEEELFITIGVTTNYSGETADVYYFLMPM